jgi:glucose/arabinose dehydrogenase
VYDEPIHHNGFIGQRLRCATHVAVTLAIVALARDASAQIRGTVQVTGLSSPVAFVQDPSNPAVQYVVELGGRIRRVANGQLTDFLNLSGQISSGGERGLLGLAFPPDFATSGRLYVYYTNPQGNLAIARFKRSSSNPVVADPLSRFEFLWPGGLRSIPHPTNSNHNGGTLAFGPDGYLYAGPGDGGSGNDPPHNAQNPNVLLGKILRLNVNVPDSDPEGYDIPPDNPFVDNVPIPALPHIWAFGLRNPWRFTFDDPTRGGTGALVIGDVGQGSYEEIDYEPAGAGGRNYGWRNREGMHDNIVSLPPAYTPLTEPIFEYTHSVGISITGGYVYRGTALGPSYAGRYFFADLSGRVWSLGLTINPTTGQATAAGLIEHTTELGGSASLGQISSFGVDASGELYVVSISLGRILRISSACRFSLDPGSAAFPPSGGNATVAVSVDPPGCSWTATSNASFVAVTGGAPGTGNGQVSLAVASNIAGLNQSTPARSGTVTIAGTSFTVTQSGCSFAIAPTAQTFGASAGSGAVNVSTPIGCSWTVTGLPPWASTTSGGGGTGPGTWRFVVQPNASAATRTDGVTIAGSSDNFTLTQLAVAVRPITWQSSGALSLADAADEVWLSSEAVQGRSYCAELSAAPNLSERASPALSAFRATAATMLAAGGTRVCFTAPASETVLWRVSQTDAGGRDYRIRAIETTLSANWWFTGGDYSSYTLLRNTSPVAANATLTWRDLNGAIVAAQTVAVSANGLIAVDARSVVGGVVSGSVEVAHGGEPQALVGTQTTLSATTGLSFDAVLRQRNPW